MIEHRTTICLALLCALVLSAVSVQSASAQVGAAATNTTAVTCVKGAGNGDFDDPHCDEKVAAGTGDYGHVAISSGQTTAIDVTNQNVKNNTSEAEAMILTSTHLGVNIEIECEAVTSSNSWMQNVENEGKHTVEGTIKLERTKCKVTKPAKCTVKEPLELIAKIKGVEGLKFQSETKAMGLELTEDGTDLTKIPFGSEVDCIFRNKTFPVTGSVIATGAPNPSAAISHSGATWILESANEMQTAKFSTSSAAIKGRFTPQMSGGGNPIALTTVT